MQNDNTGCHKIKWNSLGTLASKLTSILTHNIIIKNNYLNRLSNNHAFTNITDHLNYMLWLAVIIKYTDNYFNNDNRQYRYLNVSLKLEHLTYQSDENYKPTKLQIKKPAIKSGFIGLLFQHKHVLTALRKPYNVRLYALH